MLQESKKCFMNYEPFYWKNRMCNSVYDLSERGYAEHMRLSLYIPDSGINKYNSAYLRQITNADRYPVISKFARGNGRIGFINKETKTKKTIFISRSLRGTLNSMHGKEWSLLGRKRSKSGEWDRLKDSILFYNDSQIIEWMDCAESDLDKSALYWYFMNLVALNHIKDNNGLILNFNNIKSDSNRELAKIASYLQMGTVDLDFRYISGSSIHRNGCLINTIKNEIQPELIKKSLLSKEPQKKPHKIRSKVDTDAFEKSMYVEMDKNIKRHLGE